MRDTPPRWSRSRTHLTCLLGTGAAGPVALDLCAAGPHAVVAGTTGAGKSELLRTLVLGLASAHPPDLCSFLLVDYKGGAAFAEATDLPHTVGVLTDLDGASTARALRSLGAELTRRERLLADHGARDLAELGPQVLAPRLVIVVDEFATLGDELPGFVPGLVAIAQRGRSLGVHLVLATQRPAGSVGPEIRANCSVRLCLRTTDEAGSRDVLGVPDAAWLPVDRPGRALLRVGGDHPVALQVARVGGSGPPDGAPAVTVRPWRWPVEPVHEPATDPAERTDLVEQVARLRTRAATEGLPAPPRPWLPALPDRVPPGAPGADPSRPPGVLVWGLVDRPEVQAQEPLLVDLAAGGAGWWSVGPAAGAAPRWRRCWPPRRTGWTPTRCTCTRSTTPAAPWPVRSGAGGTPARTSSGGRPPAAAAGHPAAARGRPAPRRPGHRARPAAARRRRRLGLDGAGGAGTGLRECGAAPSAARGGRGGADRGAHRRPGAARQSAGRCGDAPAGAPAGRPCRLRGRRGAGPGRPRPSAAGPGAARRRCAGGPAGPAR
ncbi:FtsK/SpoIIIE domain-containing protein [Klenkia terrae]|uniref:FtsK/SpoIIIE domain-containing protein n=1 Tax=Klenkia terrae TaxID=1052259 RepID=UPI00360AB2F7